MKNSYNYIIVGGTNFYKVAYSGLDKDRDVCYFANFTDGIEKPWIKILTRLNFNLKVNRWIHTPFRRLVYPRLFPAHFDENKPLCYIFFGVQFAVINTNYIEYLREKQPTAKLVLFMQDIVSSLPYYDIEAYKRRFDLVLSYDKNDSLSYGLNYYPTPYSYIDPALLSSHEPIDVYFCGAAKTRYKSIFEIYRKCKDKGLTCKFFITGVPETERIIADDIIYDSKISYLENLSYAYSSKCILEIMQANAVGFTPRLWEALFYEKHLLTDNKQIMDSEYYCSETIHFIDDIDNIKNWISQKPLIKSSIIRRKHPRQLLNLIDSLL